MTERKDLERLALRPVEAARVLGVSPRTLWSWTRRGLIPYIRVGRVIRYPYSTLREWLAREARTTAGVVSESKSES